eukprot:495398_1
MKSLKTFYSLYKQYNDIANFVIIYLEEAHASDSWFSFKGNIPIKYATNINDRINACKQLVELSMEHIEGVENIIMNPQNENKIRFLIDNMNNDMNSKFTAFPERLYVVDENHKVAFQGGIGPWYYDIDEVSSFLANYKENSKENNI